MSSCLILELRIRANPYWISSAVSGFCFGLKKFCEAAVKQTIDEFGKLDVLVNNAAFQLHVMDFEDLTEEHFDLTIKTNLYGYFFMAKAAVPHMKNGSSIINTGSVTGLLGNKDLLDYSLTKGAKPDSKAIENEANSYQTRLTSMSSSLPAFFAHLRRSVK